MKKQSVTFASMVLPQAALAHPDHSHAALDLDHVLHSPFHIGLIVAALIGVGAVARILMRDLRARHAELRDRETRK